MSQKKILLIDSFNILFRSYFALEKSGLAKSDGTFTFAIYGFFKALFKAIQDIKPTDIIFALESTSSYRKQLSLEYKANRKDQPQALLDQIKLLYQILEKTQLPHFFLEGYEADDVLATLTIYYKNKDSNNIIYVYSSDKDLAQLVDNNVFLLQPSKLINQPMIVLDKQGVFEKYGVYPHQMQDYLSIVGDTSDNIKGIDGIGPKTASKLLLEYENLDQIIKFINLLSPKLKHKFESSLSTLSLSRSLTQLHIDESFIAQFSPPHLNAENLVLLEKEFQELEFTPFKEMKYLYGLLTEEDQSSLFLKDGSIAKESDIFLYKEFVKEDVNYILVQNKSDLIFMKENIKQRSYLAVDTETTGLDYDSELLGVSISYESHQAYYIPLGHKDSNIRLEDFIEVFEEIFVSPHIKKIGHNIKYDYKVLKKIFPHFKGIYFDTMIASYLLSPDNKQYSLDYLSKEHCHYKKIEYKNIVNTKSLQTLKDIDLQTVVNYACEDADITYRLYLLMKEDLKKYGLEEIFFNLEIPLISVLSDMENRGICIDKPYFISLKDVFVKELEGISQKIFYLANESLNLNSPKQISELLYSKLKLPKPKGAGRSKSVFATDEESLQALSEFEIVKNILEYRKYNKLLTTYVVPMIEKSYVVGHDVKIYTNFQQTAAATGRLSSTDPNLQNIPIRDKSGSMIRQGFIASPGYVLLGLDYSQIELRLMAHFSNDPIMIKAFKEDKDIHFTTASQIFNKDMAHISVEERNIAKTINFGIIYGMGYVKLAKELGISNNEAKTFINKYFELFSRVRSFIEETKALAHKQEYVTTLLHRKRFLKDINSTNSMWVAMNERMAVNTVIQGSNADLIKACMINITNDPDLKSARLLLQIHDELIFEVPLDDVEKISKKISDYMENIYILRVPLKVSLNTSKNWGALK